MSLPSRCHHIRMNGTQCGSPAVRHQRFCFFHFSAAPLNCEVKSYDLRPDENFVLPVLEDATSVQITISQVMSFLLRGYIDIKTARVLLTACKLASHNLRRMDAEKPRPTQMVVDTSTIQTTPFGADDLWSADSEAANPDPDCSQNQSNDSSSPSPVTPRSSFRADRRKPSEAFIEEERHRLNQMYDATLKRNEEEGRIAAARIQEEARAREQKAAQSAEPPAEPPAKKQPQPEKSADALPPGTIQARARRDRYTH